MTDCAESRSGVEGLEDLVRRAYRERVPLTASLELTRRCSLRCVHCYAGPGLGAGAGGASELSTGEWLGVLDQLTETGCLFVVLTGGEPLLRADFRAIYRHAKENGLVVTLFSNATLIDEAAADFLAEWPPRHVDITVYGATAETYERVTQVPGSYARCMRGIHALMRRGVRVTLKTVILTLNEHEFSDIEALAESLGLEFRLDAAIFGRYDGDLSPLEYRVDPERAAMREFSNSKRRQAWAAYLQKGSPTDGRLFMCGAGRSACHVNAYGMLSPCLMDVGTAYDLRGGSVVEGWQTELASRVQQSAPEGSRCAPCDKKRACGYCPLFAERESGGAGGVSAWLCRLADARVNQAASVAGAL